MTKDINAKIQFNVPSQTYKPGTKNNHIIRNWSEISIKRTAIIFCTCYSDTLLDVYKPWIIEFQNVDTFC